MQILSHVRLFLATRNVKFHINTTTGMLSPADGSATTMLFTHGCRKHSKFSTESHRKQQKALKHIKHWLR
jgi:hypothetical protein